MGTQFGDQWPASRPFDHGMLPNHQARAVDIGDCVPKLSASF